MPPKARLLFTGAALLTSISTHAQPFANADARSIAMGGTGVASRSNPLIAQFNPALLAAYSERKHKGNNQRIVFPFASAVTAINLKEAEEYEDLDYESQFNQLINDFNNGLLTTEQIDTLRAFNSDVDGLSSSPTYADGYVGFAIGIPDRNEGGAFSYSQRFSIDGRVSYTPEDRELINNYIDELEFINNGGTPEILHPELYTAGQLINPQGSLTSNIDATGLLAAEISISMAWKVNLFGSEMLLGFSPRIAEITTYEYQASAASDNFIEENEEDDNRSINFDIGWAQQITSQLMVGATLKNIIPEEFDTASGNIVERNPQLRIGSEWQSQFGTYAIDLDLTKNAALSKYGDPTQVLAAGGEWGWGKQRLRAGFNTNLAGTDDNSGINLTLGIRLQALGFAIDIAGTRGDNEESIAAQFAFWF